MKQFLITLLLLITATAASAQKKDDENFAKRLFEARLAEVCLRLNLTDDQKSKFAPIYEQYCNEMSELRGKPGEGRRPMGPGMRPGMRPGGPGQHQGMKPGMRQGKPGMRPGGAGKPANGDKADKKDKADKPTEGKQRPEGRQRPEGTQRMSDADKVKLMKERMEKQKKAQEIRLTYADKFATVLTDKQLLDFYEVENNIQEKMHNRAFKSRR